MNKINKRLIELDVSIDPRLVYNPDRKCSSICWNIGIGGNCRGVEGEECPEDCMGYDSLLDID